MCAGKSWALECIIVDSQLLSRKMKGIRRTNVQFLSFVFVKAVDLTSREIL
jgi:hypothetical protein